MLEAIGISESAEAAYRALLGRPGMTKGEVAQQLDAWTATVREWLSTLEQRGLVNRTMGRPTRFVPTPPEAAIEVLALNRRRDLEQARLAAKDLEAAFRRRRRGGPDPVPVRLARRQARLGRLGSNDGGFHGRIATMKTTIDNAGRVVIPKPVREAAGWRPGTELAVTHQDGRIHLEAVSKPMRLVERDGFLAAELEGDDGTPLSVEEVRALLERVRR